jgi:hypothetical protein
MESSFQVPQILHSLDVRKFSFVQDVKVNTNANKNVDKIDKIRFIIELF